MNSASEPERHFSIKARDGAARAGTFRTAHGQFRTPAFMPVGTQGTVKGVLPEQLRELGAEILLANTYHLHLRPGDTLIKELGGLHRFMQWDGPILTDSGGFQVYSLAKLRRLDEDGVSFQSHIDGATVRFTPERVVEIQENLGVDIMMVLDECTPYGVTYEEAAASLERTARWARRSRDARTRRETFAFGIVQGGMYRELRTRSAEATVEVGFDGYAIGGVSVGEPTELMREITEHTAPLLPDDSLRYLMGVGTPADILHAVSCGVDLFDCVIPTRSARFGRLFVPGGHINIRNTKYRADDSPIYSGCDCYTCQRYSRAYLAHLVHAQEVLAVTLATLHNLRFYERLMAEIRSAIIAGQFQDYSKRVLAAGEESGIGE